MADRKLDCKRMNCPMPIVQLSKAMRKLEVGQQIEIEATDPAFQADLEAWVQRMGHTLDSFAEGEVKRALVTKAK